ncbi:MAG: nuclear transport factor 2 family protein [Microthrixaceae bacterium]
MPDEEQHRREIIDLAVAYCRIVDSGDFDSLRKVFTPAASAQLGGSGQSGIAEIMERLSTALGKFDSWEHHVDAHQVSVDGLSASASCSVRAVHVRPEGSSPRTDTIIGTYDDKLVHTADGWRISHRCLTVVDRW